MFRAKDREGKWIYGTNIFTDKTYNKEIDYLTSKDINNEYQFPLRRIYSKAFKSTNDIDSLGIVIYEGDYIIGDTYWTDLEKEDKNNWPINSSRKKLLFKVIEENNKFKLEVVRVEYYEIEKLIADMISDGNQKKTLEEKIICGKWGWIDEMESVLVVGNELDTDSEGVKRLFEKYILTVKEEKNEN